MPCQFMVDRLFQGSSAVAFAGFLLLCAEALRAISKLRKKRRAKAKAKAKADGPVALSAVTSGDEPHKPPKAPKTTPDGHQPPPEPAEEKGPDYHGARRTLPLHDKKHALTAQARALRRGDTTTPEISHVTRAYLSAAEDLLKQNRAGPGPEGGVRRTDAALNAAADAARSLLQAEADRNNNNNHVRPGLAALCAVAAVSVLAVVAATSAAKAAEAQVVPGGGGQRIDLARYTLRGEPRAHGIPACLRAALHVSRAISEGAGLVLSLVLWPADAAFACLASALLRLGLPLGVCAVGVLSVLCIVAVAVAACVCVAVDGVAHEDEDGLDVAGGREQDAGR